jgi:diacylglycerol kinase
MPVVRSNFSLGPFATFLPRETKALSPINIVLAMTSKVAQSAVAGARIHSPGHLSVAEWLFVFGAIGLVLTTELLNTALEELCDMLKDTHDPHVAKIKDLAAGAVLCASLCALAIGLIIFLPKFFAL